MLGIFICYVYVRYIYTELKQKVYQDIYIYIYIYIYINTYI